MTLEQRFNKFIKTDYCGPDVPPEYYVSEDANVMLSFIRTELQYQKISLLSGIEKAVEGMKRKAEIEIEKCNKSDSTSFAEDGGDELVGRVEALSDVLLIIKKMRGVK